jgi:hypothetical protein
MIVHICLPHRVKRLKTANNNICKSMGHGKWVPCDNSIAQPQAVAEDNLHI